MAAIRRILVAVGTIVLVAGGLVLASASTASACSCAQMSLGSLAKEADTVFVGTVDAQRTENGERVYTLRVSDVYSGSPGATTTVRTEASEAACGMALELHQQYMVVGDQAAQHGDVRISLCSGTRPISDRAIAAVESALGPATPYRGAPDRGGDHHGDKGNSGNGHNGNGQGQTNSTENATGSDDATTASADAANESGDQSTTSKVVVGLLLALAIGAAFALPRLRRRHRHGGEEASDE